MAEPTNAARDAAWQQVVDSPTYQYRSQMEMLGLKSWFDRGWAACLATPSRVRSEGDS